MKKWFFHIFAVPISLLSLAFFAGCNYEAPLVVEDKLPIEPALLGVWASHEAGGAVHSDDMITVLRFSDTEYLVSTKFSETVLQFRAYAIRLGEVECLQLEVIGSGGGPIPADETERYLVFNYSLEADRLTVRMLNDELVPNELKTTKALQSAFLKHKDDPELFRDAEVYIRKN